MLVAIACIVEGHGEREAVPVIVRRIAAAVDPTVDLRIPHPIRVPKGRLLRAGELERALALASARVRGTPGGVLVVLDSDDDCPADLGPALVAQARARQLGVPVGVVLAKREFEAWFLAAAESLRGQRGLVADLGPPDNPEGIQGAKEWLSERMTGQRGYRETLDQPALAALLDFDQARRAPSFDKCWREVVSLVGSGAPRGVP
jgi:hypothetical protein